MKKKSSVVLFSQGALRVSTLQLLAAGGMLGLVGCEKEQARVSVVDERQQREMRDLEEKRKKMEKGELSNNYHLEELGYYHAAAQDFFPFPYNSRDKENRYYYVNGEYQDAAGPTDVADSRPKPEALKKVEEYLARETKELDAQEARNQQVPHSYHSGPGIGTYMMMYWLIQQNRQHGYQPGVGYGQAAARAQKVEVARERSRMGGTMVGASGRSGSSSGSGESRGGAAASPSSRGGFGGSWFSSGS